MRFHLVGGFLGSGKTTAILQASQLLTERGQKVAIITNEQGRHLVDTGFIRSHDLPALQVTGGCICCHLDDFEERVEEIASRFNPDTLFAESVGSCADLVATVIKPLEEYRKTSARPASLSVFTDARLLLRYLRGQEMPFSEGIVYIFEKQIEETGLLVINKIDLLSGDDAREVIRLAQRMYPAKSIRPQNSLDADEVAGWLDLVQSAAAPEPGSPLDIDYDIYAQGEGQFAWLDRQLEIQGGEQYQSTAIVTLLQNIADCLLETGQPIAHLKFLLESNSGSRKFSLTAMDQNQALSSYQRIKKITGPDFRLTINAMMEGDMDFLSSQLDNIIEEICRKHGFRYRELSRFNRTPGYPKPTVRIETE